MTVLELKGSLFEVVLYDSIVSLFFVISLGKQNYPLF
jgi:hypothetical protein